MGARAVKAFPVEKALQVLSENAWLEAICNLYSMTRTREEVRALTGSPRDLTANQPPLPGVYPDYAAPIVRVEKGERIVANALGPALAAVCTEGSQQ